MPTLIINMSKFIIALILSCAGSVFASEQIARDNQCFKCHAIDASKKAPSFKSIAKNEVASDIEQVVRKGIKSLFGTQKMPANTAMSDADLKSLTQWILQQ